ncbi:CBS domain-containing protein [Pedobacter psychrotolerans]|uniref:CBS domain-containing protein n=1 Tax=Pedobacter psychrotolerans TaxID=1843235 RepID=UPI003F95BE36
MSQKIESTFSQIQKTSKKLKTTPKKILHLLGVARRGPNVIETIEVLLEKYDLFSLPSFGKAEINSIIEIHAKDKVKSAFKIGENNKPDFVPKLSLLKAADLTKTSLAGKNGLYSVTRDTTLQEATSMMMMHNFSQLPILSGKNKVEGIVSWKSIGRALSLGWECKRVFDCMEEVQILKLESPLLDSVKIILEQEVVLVKDIQNNICGILTLADITEQFAKFSQPFLILEQIENYVRLILHDKIILELISKVIDNEIIGKEVQLISDLSFGQYIRIIEHPTIFPKLGLKIDKKLLIEQLEKVREIRNKIMHFRPETISIEELETLQKTLQFFANLSPGIQ